jgi:hypothetical protein
MLVLPPRPKRQLEAENAALKRQLAMLQRKQRGRVQLTNSGRLFFVQLYRWFPLILGTMTIYPTGDATALASPGHLRVLALEIQEPRRTAICRSVRRVMISSVIAGSPNQVGCSQPDPIERTDNDHREAARPLRRYLWARVRAASLPPSYTISWDMTLAPRA